LINWGFGSEKRGSERAWIGWPSVFRVSRSPAAIFPTQRARKAGRNVCVCEKRGERRRKQGRKTKADKSETGEWIYFRRRATPLLRFSLAAFPAGGKLRCNFAS